MASGINGWQQHLPQLSTLAGLPYNYDDFHQSEFTSRLGWKRDHYSAVIADEPPGPTLPDGPFARAREILRTYRFPPPSLIKGFFNPDLQLEGRNMLLRARFLGFTFYFGTRVNKVISETRFDSQRGPLVAWGYSYRTLQGHFEMGQIRFEVVKYLETGHIEFHINAYSKPGRIPQFWYRWGFRIFGRFLQKRFAHASISRMRRMVHEAALRPAKAAPSLW
jgi:hypothetical protein